MPKIDATRNRRFDLKSPAERSILLVAILIAVMHAFMAVTAVNTKSPTFDEPLHLTAGYSFFATNDFRLDPENGTLPAVWAALPLLFDNLNFVPLNDRGWQRAEEGRTAHQFFYEVGNDPDRMLRQARVMMSVFGAALCLLIFRIARHFFGTLGGLLAEIVAAFDPNFLAHSPLVASDVAAAFFFTATVWCCWRMLQAVTPVRVLFAAFSLCGLFLTKFSAPLVLPVLGGISILQIFSGEKIKLEFARIRTEITQTWKKAAAIAAVWFLLGVVLFAAIWGSCSFRFAAWKDGRADHEGTVWHWKYLLEDGGPFQNSINFARGHHLLPEAYLYGFAYVRKHEIDRPSFLDNRWSIVGFRSFFPRAFLYKTPLPCLALFLLALCAVVANRRSNRIEHILNPLSAFAVIYAAFAVTAQLNIGHRHLFPAYPALFVACGAAVYLLRGRGQTVFAAVISILALWQVTESVASQPDYLAYFNQLAGGPARGYQHLVDSSVDWGQDLPTLKDWLDDHHRANDGRPVYLAYFGTADPRWYGIHARTLQSGRAQPEEQNLTAMSGGLYCVSATTLQSVYAMEIGPWCAEYERRYQGALREWQRAEKQSGADAVPSTVSNRSSLQTAAKISRLERLRFARLCAYLRHQEPLAHIGHSIFVFQLSDEQVHRALYGPPTELEAQVLVAGY